MSDYTLINGDCLDALRTLDDNSIDAVITDPPYGLSNTTPAQVADTIARWAQGDTEHVPQGKGYLGAAWDGFVPPPAVWSECLRVLKPGGHLIVFAGTRTQDLMGISVRLAGFDVRDNMAWIYGSGFPKGQSLDKAIDKRLGAQREVVGTYMGASNIGKKADGKWGYGTTGDSNKGADRTVEITVPATPEAAQWEGWHTQLKPAHEPIIVARKPFGGALVDNVMTHGTGAINIDGERVDPRGSDTTPARYPANVILDEQAADALDDASDEQGASRFFHVFKYAKKAARRERPEVTRDDGTKVVHATVKPLELMSHLVGLVAPPGSVVLDPFAGSGTTLEAARNNGSRSIGIEQSADYCDLIRERMDN